MKLLIFTFMLIRVCIASQEHLPNMELKPSTKGLNLSRSCFQAMEDLGCGTPKENRRDYKNCLLLHKENLSSECQEFLSKLYLK